MNVATPARSHGKADTSARMFPPGYAVAFMLVIALFFLWGMSNNLTDILVQQFRKSFELSPVEAQLVQTAVFMGYFCMALPMAIAMRRWGYKIGMLCGLLLFGSGMLMFWPAATMARYSLMLTALFMVGCGSATLETAANPFMAEAGPPESSERRLNLAAAFNPAGSITGILVGTYFIFSGVDLSPARVAAMKAHGTYAGYLHSELMRVVPTYVTFGCVVLACAAILAKVELPPISSASEPLTAEPLGFQLKALLRTGSLRGAVLAQFCYCGAQVATWSAFIPYARQYTQITEREAGLLLTGNLVALTCGRFVSTALMRWVSAGPMMVLYSLINILLVAVAVVHPGAVGAAALVITSFFMSIMFPTIFATGIKGLGERTKLAGSLLVMSVVGGAVLPPLLGLLALKFNSYAAGYSIVAVCYVIVGIYAARTRVDANLSEAPNVV